MSVKNRGFASMTAAQRRDIASRGGKAAHRKGVAHVWTSAEARQAGRRGGQASQIKKREEQDEHDRARMDSDKG